MIVIAEITTELRGAKEVARSWNQVVQRASKGAAITLTDPKTGQRFELRLKQGEA